MKMKLKATLLAAAAVLGMAGNASAALQDAASGSSALIFSAWDPTTGASYSRALGTNLNSFLPNGPSGTLSFAADSTFTTLFGSIANNTNLLWNVAAADSNGSAGVGDTGSLKRLAATSSTLTPTISASNNSAATSNFNSFIGQLNGSPCSFGANTGSCSSSSASDLWNVNNAVGSTWGVNAGLSSAYFTAGSVGQSLFFLLTSAVGALPTTAATKAFYLASGTPETWTLQTDGTLVWSGAPVSNVPVPAAVWLLGSGLMGLIGVARRREGRKGDVNMNMAAA